MKKRSGYLKKSAAWLLIVSVAAALAGCGTGNKEAGGSSGSGTANQAGTAGGETVAMGRYVEGNIPLPFEDGAERVINCIKKLDGTLELYTLKMGEMSEDGGGYFTGTSVYDYDGSQWNRVEEPLISALPEGKYADYAAYGPDGSLYAIYADDEYKAHLVKITPDRQLHELNAELGKNMVGVNGLHVMADGTILVPESDQVHIISPDGTPQKKVPRANSDSNFNDSHTLLDNSFVVAGESGFLRYDTENWNEKEMIPFQDGATDLYASLTAGEGEDFYLCNSRGIHHMTEGGTIWETIVDGTLVSLGMPSVYVSKVFVGAADDFYVWYKDGESDKMAHYTYDAEMPSVPSRTLTVYGLDLDSNKTVLQAASLFQMENPDVRVELMSGGLESGGASKSDTIRSLNAELLNGKGADVLVLDGLPYRSYVEKGVLENLKDTISPLVASGDLYSNIAESFEDQEGQIFQFPVRVNFPITYGDEGAAGNLASLDTLYDYQKANPEKPLLSKTVYENILRQMIHIYYPEMVSKDTGELIPGRMEKLLETAKAVGDASGSAVSFDKSEDGDYGEMYNRIMTNGFAGFSMMMLLEDKIPFAIELPGGMMDMLFPYAICEKKGCEIRPLNDIYYTKGLLGVTSFGKEKETAREFVKFALSKQVQESDLGDGLPVNRSAADSWAEKESAVSIGVGYGESREPLFAAYPGLEKRTQFMGMLGELKTPISVDDVLLEMMINETKGYFEGTQTAGQAAQAVENKAKLYYSE